VGETPASRIGEYDAVIAEDGDSSDFVAVDRVAWALQSKAAALAGLGRPDEALRLLDEVVERCQGRQEPELQARTAVALSSKASLLRKERRFPEALSVSSELVARFDTSADPELRRLLADALLRKGVVLSLMKREADALTAFDDVVRRFGGDRNSSILRGVAATGLVNRGNSLKALKRPDEAIASYEAALDRLRDDGGGSTDLVASSMYGKADALASQRRWDDALDALDGLLTRFGGGDDERVEATIARAHVKKAWLLARHLEQGDEAIAIYRQAIERFADTTDTDIRRTVASALCGLALTLCTMWRPAEALPVAEPVISRYGDATEPGFQPVRAARRVRRIARAQLLLRRLVGRRDG
jgi:tetratricopeptide (TPR) repeat protein